MCVGIAAAVAVALFAAVKSYPVDYDSAGELLVDGARLKHRNLSTISKKAAQTQAPPKRDFSG
jgi:hypothetical protein